MRALRLTAPRQAEVVDVEDPTPGPGEVLVRIEACGVCGSDLNAWRGVLGIEYPLPPGAPGHETWGEVVKLGSGVSGLHVGDCVTGLMWNGFAELGTARAEDLVVLPESIGGLLGEPLACAMNVVRRSAIGLTDRVAIVGFGYLAALVVHLLPAGVEWVAISRREDSRALAMRLGAAAAFSFGDVPSSLWDSFPVVIEAAGVQQTLDFATWLTAYGGRLVIAGYHADGSRAVNMQSWNWKGIDVINAHARQPSVYMAALQSVVQQLQRAQDGGERRTRLAQLVTHAWPLAAAGNAFVTAEERPTGYIKGVVQPAVTDDIAATGYRVGYCGSGDV